jgi:hypothetical protein
MDELPDHVSRNLTWWDIAAEEYVAPGERSWASDSRGGDWGVAESSSTCSPPTRGERR